MYRFSAQGRIGRIDRPKDTDEIVRISLAADRLVEGRDGSWTKTEWLNCVSFDTTLNQKLLTELDKGQSVTFDGRIETRPRKVGGGDMKITDYNFIITGFTRHSIPKEAGVTTAAQKNEKATAKTK